MDTLSIIIIVSFFAVSLLGVLVHFFHKWFRIGIFVHIFSAINESVWEHMKLSYYPMVITMVIHSLLPNVYYPGFWGDAFITVLTATALVPILYYPIRAALGKEIPAISISLYFVCILFAFILEYYLLKNHVAFINEELGVIGFVAGFILFGIFTYYPPKLPIFKDPIYKKYGEFRQKFDKRKH